jgi:hypothetical protein
MVRKFLMLFSFFTILSQSKQLLVQQVVQQGLEQLLAKTLTDLVKGIRSFKTNPQGEGSKKKKKKKKEKKKNVCPVAPCSL